MTAPDPTPEQIAAAVEAFDRQRPPPKRREFVIAFAPLPGIDGARALQALLKIARRRLGLRCTRLEGPGQ